MAEANPTQSQGSPSQWGQVLDLSLFGDVWNFYKRLELPLEVRIWLSPSWLEYHVAHIGQRANPDNSDDIGYFDNFMANFFQQLQVCADNVVTQARQKGDPKGQAIGYDLQRETMQLMSRFHNNSIGLFQTIKACLDHERELIRQKLGRAVSPSPIPMLQRPQQQMQPQALSPTARYNNLDTMLNRIINGGQTMSTMSSSLYSLLPTGLSNNAPNDRPTLIEEVNRVKDIIQRMVGEIAQTKAEYDCLTGDLQQLRMQTQNGFFAELQVAQSAWTVKKNSLVEQMTILMTEVNNFRLKVKSALDGLKSALAELHSVIDDWQYEQRGVANGFPMSHSLERISTLANMFARGVIDLKRYLLIKTSVEQCLQQNGEDTLTVSQIFNEFKSELDNLLWGIVSKTFVVETQPPQLLRLKAPIKQDVKVELLVGSTLIPNDALTVKTLLIDKEEAEKLHNNPLHMPKRSIKITNNEAKMCRTDDHRSRFVATFNSITLPSSRKGEEVDEGESGSVNGNDHGGKGVRKGGKKGQAKEGGNCANGSGDDKFVPQKKYCFYFTAVFSGPDMPSFTVCTTSLPVIITCHPSQDADAWATIVWDNAVSLKNRKPFDVPREANAVDLVENLGHVFKLQTRGELTTSHKQFLLQKLMGNNTTGIVTWKMFFEDKIECAPCKRPTAVEAQSKNNKDGQPEKIHFHSWLFYIKRLCEPSSKVERGGSGAYKGTRARAAPASANKDATSVPSHWAGKFIEGFISKEDLEAKLRTAQSGTFILYFSEAILGALTVAWYNHEDQKVNKFAPYELKELKEQPLEDRILATKNLRYLYPNSPKETVFHRIREYNEITNTQYELISKGYILHTQQQVAQVTGRMRQLSVSSNASTTSGYGSSMAMEHINSPASVSSYGYNSPHSSSANSPSAVVPVPSPQGMPHSPQPPMSPLEMTFNNNCRPTSPDMMEIMQYLQDLEPTFNFSTN